MNIETLLTAVDKYIRTKKETEHDETVMCSDWDCGIANELSGGFIDPDHQQQLDQAKAALETALNQYIDARIASRLKVRSNE